MKLRSWFLAVESTKVSILWEWEWVAIFRASFVEVHEIYTHPPFSIGLFNHDDVCQPVRVVYFWDEIYL